MGYCSKGKIDVEADSFASGFVGAQIGGFHDAGTTAGGDYKTSAARGNLNGPLGQKECQTARVFVVTGHIDGSKGLLQVLFLLWGGRFRVVFFRCRQILPCGGASLKAGRAEEDDRVLDLLAAKTRQRFLVLRQNAQNASVGTAEEGFVLVGQGRGLKFIGHVETH